ncbi:MAG TPA: heme-binding protein [Kofleriaceae bacterium]|nr:heme-binding protein [Kofleriaceae bacterium]
MNPFVDESTANVVGSLPSVFDHFPRARTQARHPARWRKLGWLASFLAVPAAAGFAYSRSTTLRRGVLAGGLTALALGALRFELARWFTPEPAFQPEGKIGDLEIRRYATRVEACAEVDRPVLEQALDQGYTRLAEFVCGANQSRQILQRTVPVLIAMRDGRYTVSFVMPPGRDIASLPRPTHPAIELREVPSRTIAALRFRGRFTRDNIAAHERDLLQQLVDSGLSARGSVAFAAFDSPATLPLLRRNELWIEIV